jgi:multidrug efflux pump subunit AcrA (membrane-fusion protein)
MKSTYQRYQFILWTSGLLLVACTKSKVDLPANAQQPAAAPAAAADGAQAAPAATTPAPAEAAAPAATAQVDINSTRLSGEVASQTKSQLSFRVGGFIQELKYKTGMTCKKGDVLAVLDTRDYRLTADMARSQKDMAKVALTNAQSEFQREEELKKANVSTESMYDKLKAVMTKPNSICRWLS